METSASWVIGKRISQIFPVEYPEKKLSGWASNRIHMRRHSFHRDLLGRVTIHAWDPFQNTCLIQFLRRSFAKPLLKTVHLLGTLLQRRSLESLILQCTA